MVYVPVTYIPDGPATRALKRHVRKSRPKPLLGNLGPLLDENLTAARKYGHFRYHPDELKLIKGVVENPEVVDEGFEVLLELLREQGIAEPTHFTREAPYYPDVRSILKFTLLLAAVMTAAITVAIVLGQEDAVAEMTVAIVLISLIGTGLFALIIKYCVVRVSPDV